MSTWTVVVFFPGGEYAGKVTHKLRFFWKIIPCKYVEPYLGDYVVGSTYVDSAMLCVIRNGDRHTSYLNRLDNSLHFHPVISSGWAPEQRASSYLWGTCRRPIYRHIAVSPATPQSMDWVPYRIRQANMLPSLQNGGVARHPLQVPKLGRSLFRGAPYAPAPCILVTDVKR